MKTLTILSLIFSFLLTHKVRNDYISFEYAGAVDHRMDVIFISKKVIPKSALVVSFGYSGWPINYLVSDHECSFIKKTIKSIKKKNYQQEDENGFKISVSEDNTNKCYFITRTDSDETFEKIIADLKKRNADQELISELFSLYRSNRF